MDPLIGAALLSGGANLIGGIAGRGAARRQDRAAREAAQLEYQAAQDAIAEDRAQFQQTRQDLSRYRGAGDQTIGQLLAGLQGGEFDAPAFNFQESKPFSFDTGTNSKAQMLIQEAMRGVNASAAARGGLLSGGAQKALQDNAARIASGVESEAYGRYQGEDATRYGRAADQYNRGYGARQDRANRLQSVAGMGLDAATRTGQFGQQSAQNIGRLGMSGAASLGEGLTQGAAYRGAGDNALWSNIQTGANDAARAWGLRGTGGMLYDGADNMRNRRLGYT